jgi:predicted nucleic acid-binding protein
MVLFLILAGSVVVLQRHILVLPYQASSAAGAIPPLPCRAPSPLAPFPLPDGCRTLSCVLIFDSSTLILLAKSELLDIFLDDFQGTPCLPAAVEEESTCDSSRPDGVLIQQRVREGRLAIEEIRQPKVLSRLIQDFRLGAGEAEALALALEQEETAIVATDDRNGIRACRVLRIDFVTSLGILVRAVENGLLTQEDGMRSLERLTAFGRFRDEIIEEVSRQIGGTAHGKGSKDG